MKKTCVLCGGVGRINQTPQNYGQGYRCGKCHDAGYVDTDDHYYKEITDRVRNRDNEAITNYHRVMSILTEWTLFRGIHEVCHCGLCESLGDAVREYHAKEEDRKNG